MGRNDLVHELYQANGQENRNQDAINLFDEIARKQIIKNCAENLYSPSWSSVLLQDSVRITLKKKTERSAVLKSLTGVSLAEDHVFLNVGAPVWALDFSNPIISDEEKFTVLAIGTTAWSAPIMPDKITGPSNGLIQLWKVDLETRQTQLRMALVLYDHCSCRSLKWIHNSYTESDVGLLTAVVKGEVLVYAIPLEPFFDQSSDSPVLLTVETPGCRFKHDNGCFTCVAPCPYLVSSSILRLAAGGSDGAVYIFYLGLNFSDQIKIQPFTSTGPISCLSWCPIPNTELLAIADVRGVLAVWDVTYPHDGLVQFVEGPKRPYYDLHWTAYARFILGSHLVAHIRDSKKKGIYFE